jgi:CheY-like chemotaxis protein
MHILFVDDVSDTRHLFSMVFVLEGHRTMTASGGWEALELLQQQVFDVVVLDLDMPQVSGWQVLEVIRQSPLHQSVPVILFTAYHDPLLNQRALDAGAYTLLRKPIRPEDLLDVIQSAVTSASS